MRKRFGFLVIAAVVGASLLMPDAALARRCGRHHHRNRGCCGASYSSPCGGASNCGYGGYGGCGTGCASGGGVGGGNYAPSPAPAMGGPPPAPAGETAPPPPAPTAGA